MDISSEEQTMLSAIRETGLHPINVLVVLHNSFRNDNKNRRWDRKLETLDEYIEMLSDDE